MSGFGFTAAGTTYDDEDRLTGFPRTNGPIEELPTVGDGTNGTIHYYHRNQQYSITAVTTSAGAIAERYAYSAYGEPTICDASGSVIASSTINNRYSYTGREWDATVGLYHFRARWMSPMTGRFLGRDPMRYVDGMSMYRAYFAIKSTDPTGKRDYSCVACIACTIAFETACGITCADGGYWDVPGEGWLSCMGKCNLAFADICLRPTSMHVCTVCTVGCIACVHKKYKDFRNPPGPLPPAPPTPDPYPYAPPTGPRVCPPKGGPPNPYA
jgi:RHS repeat-associated protein